MQMHSETNNAALDGYIPLDHRQNQAALFAEKNGLATAEDVRPDCKARVIVGKVAFRSQRYNARRWVYEA